jgi:hypothetical protein
MEEILSLDSLYNPLEFPEHLQWHKKELSHIRYTQTLVQEPRYEEISLCTRLKEGDKENIQGVSWAQSKGYRSVYREDAYAWRYGAALSVLFQLQYALLEIPILGGYGAISV